MQYTCPKIKGVIDIYGTPFGSKRKVFHVMETPDYFHRRLFCLAMSERGFTQVQIAAAIGLTRSRAAQLCEQGRRLRSIFERVYAQTNESDSAAFAQMVAESDAAPGSILDSFTGPHLPPQD